MADSSISEKLTSLGKSKFRSKFKLSQKDREYITTKGLETIKDHAYQFINSRVAPAYPNNIQYSSLSTEPPPVVGNVFKNGMVS
jgi:hypothetical protein